MAEPTTWTVSPFISEVQPISASDEEIRRHLADAELQPLLPALAYATGDLGLLREDLRPDPVMMAMPSGTGFSDEQADAIRELALRTLIRFRDEGCRPAPPPSDEDLLRILEHAVGGDTTLGGNSNKGHDFPWAFQGPGWNQAELEDLLEYLKTF